MQNVIRPATSSAHRNGCDERSARGVKREKVLVNPNGVEPDRYSPAIGGSAIRARYGLDTPGAQVEVIERDDGVIELHPHVQVPSEQAWFWTERWQKMEREVDEHVASGETTVFGTADEFFSHLDSIEPEE